MKKNSECQARKKRIRNVMVQFWVSETEAERMRENMLKNNQKNLSEFLRMLVLSDVKVTIHADTPEIVHVEEAHIGEPINEHREHKRAAG